MPSSVKPPAQNESTQGDSIRAIPRPLKRRRLKTVDSETSESDHADDEREETSRQKNKPKKAKAKTKAALQKKKPKRKAKVPSKKNSLDKNGPGIQFFIVHIYFKVS